MPEEKQEAGEMTTAIIRDGHVTGQPVAEPRAQDKAQQRRSRAPASAGGGQHPGGRPPPGADVRRGAGHSSGSGPSGGPRGITVKMERVDSGDEEGPRKRPRDGDDVRTAQDSCC